MTHLKVKKLISFAFLACVLIACHKDDRVVVIKPKINSILMGDTSNLSVKSVEGTGEIDIDSDGKSDLKIENFNVRLQGGTNGSTGINISCLNDRIQLACITRNDSIFKHISYQNYTDNNKVYNIATIFNYICGRISSIDEFYSLNKNVLLINQFKLGEELNQNTNFTNREMEIRYRFNRYGNLISKKLNASLDTAIITAESWDTDCSATLYADLFYVGFKINFKGEDRLGWLKISWKIGEDPKLIETGVNL